MMNVSLYYNVFFWYVCITLVPDAQRWLITSIDVSKVHYATKVYTTVSFSSVNFPSFMWTDSNYLTTLMIHHCGANLSKQYIAGLMFHHGTQTMHESRICQCLLFQLHVAKQYSYYHTCLQIAAISPVKETTMATFILGLNFTLKLWAESLVLMSVNYAWPLPEVTSSTA